MNIYEYQAKVAELEATILAINSESFILESLQLIVESHSDIAKPEFLFVRGYTPGFNDGELCTHSSYIMDYNEFAEEYGGDPEGVCQRLDIEYDEDTISDICVYDLPINVAYEESKDALNKAHQSKFDPESYESKYSKHPSVISFNYDINMLSPLIERIYDTDYEIIFKLQADGTYTLNKEEYCCGY